MKVKLDIDIKKYWRVKHLEGLTAAWFILIYELHRDNDGALCCYMAYTADYLESISNATSLNTFQVPLNTYNSSVKHKYLV